MKRRRRGGGGRGAPLSEVVEGEIGGGWNPESRHEFVEMESHGHVDSNSDSF